MPLDDTMPEAVERQYARTVFQGGLNWYRIRTAAGGQCIRSTILGREEIEPICSFISAFISGDKVCGTYQEPNALETNDQHRRMLRFPITQSAQKGLDIGVLRGLRMSWCRSSLN
ncbi:alpha/beta-hydrolase [Penicillium lividum]|nr:alpha/beta-hydrolase [Penicillium lividum]